MEYEAIVDTLVDLTGSLVAGPGASKEDLEEARAALAAALAGGQAVESIAPAHVRPRAPSAEAKTALGESLRAKVAVKTKAKKGKKETAEAPLPTLALLRTSPIRSDLDPSTPDWARGMATLRSHGPFLTTEGVATWVDQFVVVKRTTLARAPGAEPMAIFPRVTGLVVSAMAKKQIFLGKGSVWIAAKQLAASSPSGSFVGVRIQKGVIQLDADFTEVNGVLQIPATAVATMTLDLDPPAAPAPVTGPGADASRCQCNMPKTAVFELGPSKGTVKSLTPFDVTVYGVQVAFQRNAAAPIYGAGTKHVYVPCDVGLPKFTVDPKKQLSQLFQLSATAPVKHGSWALPVAVAPPAALAEAAGVGAASFSVVKGWDVQWTALEKAEAVSKATVFVSAGALSMLVTVVQESGRQAFDLWDEEPIGGKPRRASLAAEYTSKVAILYLSAPGTEVVFIGGRAVAHTDRPLGADSTRFPLSVKSSVVSLIENSTGTFIVAFGASDLTPPLRRAAIALDNALLQVNDPNGFRLVGKLDKTGVSAGLFHMDFGIRGVLPTLPDPYAATFSGSAVREGTIGTATSSVAWAAPPNPTLTFSLAFAQGVGGFATEVHTAMLSHGPTGAVAMLDVSTNADQFGVALAPRQASDIVVDDLALASAGKNVYVFTVPEITWEPMRGDPASFKPPDSPPPPVILPPNDGGPSSIHVDTVHLTPVAPIPALAKCVQRAQAGDDGNVYMTLPFGLRAHADITQITSKGGVFELNAPKFDGDVKGGLQVKMQPPGWQNEAALFNGDANTVVPYGNDVLGNSVAKIFNDDFSTVDPSIRRGLPLRRYDLSGYGASVFSDWRDATATGVRIIQARFDVMVGRTAYEVVKAQSMLFPWGVRVVRTVTIDRRAAGWVNRHDSGWQAATDGVFNFSYAVKDFWGHVHAGPVPGVYNVRNIRETLDPTVKFVVGGENCEFQPCLFDADVRLADKLKVVSGGVAVPGKGTLVQSRDMKGYIQLRPDPFANRQQLAALLDKVGPTGGKVACTVQVAATGAQKGIGMRGVSVDVSYADNPVGAHLSNADIVAALRGTILLPRDGAWSIGRRSGNETAPSALDPNFAVPLTRNVNDANTWHIADPVDIARLDTPFHEFGFVQGTGTQKIFFPRPRMVQGAQKVQMPQPPRLADVGALLNATGLFPNLGDALQFNSNPDLDVEGEDLGLTKLSFPLPKNLTKPVMNFGPVKVDIAYCDEGGNPTTVTVKITPKSDPRWEVKLEKIAFQVTIDALGKDPLLKIFGKAHADSNSPPAFDGLTVVYGEILALVQEVFSKLQDLIGILPGGDAKLDVGLSNGRLTVRQSISIPKLPLGFGYLKDVALYIGFAAQLTPQSLDFSVGIGSVEKPFHWLCSPLSGTGVLEVGSRNGALQLLIEAGLGVGLAIDVGIASGSASVVLRFRVDNHVVWPDKFKITILLTGVASVEVLGGLASASLNLTAGLGIIPDVAPIPAYITLVGSVAVGIHISVCWVISIDFEGSWQFSQTLTSPVS